MLQLELPTPKNSSTNN